MEQTTERLDALAAWLAAAPMLTGMEILLDEAGPALKKAGLFPQGVQVRQITETITGTVRTVCRQKIKLRLALPLPQGDKVTAAANAALVQHLQEWVNGQSACGLAPRLGSTDTERETITTSEGKLERTDSHGGGIYSLLLTADYTILYEGE